MNWIGQSIRNTDALIDVYCAELQSAEERAPYSFDWLSRFFDYLHGNYPHARILLQRCRDWAIHADVIIRNCFKVRSSRLELAEKGTYDELEAASPVVRAVGGSPQPRGINQFKMPYHPTVIVCTDVLKEGEDLHVFCDQVVHYGVAWTSGDLEQRVGRVDRFFSQIERRVQAQRTAQMPIYYPHLFGSIERRQVVTVRRRVAVAERFLGDVDVAQKESREIDVSQPMPSEAHSPVRTVADASHPFDVRDEDFDDNAAPLVHDKQRQGMTAEALQHLVESTLREMDLGSFEPLYELAPPGNLTDLRWKIVGGAADRTREVRLRWDFVPELGCQALTAQLNASASNPDDDEVLGAYYEAVSEGDRERARLDRLVLPADLPDASHAQAVTRFLRYVAQPTVTPATDAARVQSVARALAVSVGARAASLGTDGHRIKLPFDALPGRTQTLRAYVYDEMVLLSSVARRIGLHPPVRFGSGVEGTRALARWICDENARLRAGYIHHHRPGTADAALCYCERVFHWPVAGNTLSALVRDVVLYADGLELYFGDGEDVE